MRSSSLSLSAVLALFLFAVATAIFHTASRHCGNLTNICRRTPLQRPPPRRREPSDRSPCLSLPTASSLRWIFSPHRDAICVWVLVTSTNTAKTSTTGLIDLTHSKTSAKHRQQLITLLNRPKIFLSLFIEQRERHSFPSFGVWTTTIRLSFV